MLIKFLRKLEVFYEYVLSIPMKMYEEYIMFQVVTKLLITCYNFVNFR